MDFETQVPIQITPLRKGRCEWCSLQHVAMVSETYLNTIVTAGM